MAASVVRLFVSVRSLRGVKSGRHWSESPSHWIFLYVKPFNVALQRYHETYFTSRPSLVPPEGLALVSGGYRDALMYPRLASVPSLEIIQRSALPNWSFLGWGPVNTKHTVVFLYLLVFF